MHFQHALAIVQRCTRRSLVFCGAVVLLVATASLPRALGEEAWRQQITGEEAILGALEQKVSFSYVDEPLCHTLERLLRDTLRIETQIDHCVFDYLGGGTDVPLTESVTKLKLRSALDLILRNLDLAWTVRDEVLLITTLVEAELHMTTRVYDLGDLLSIYDLDGRKWQDFDSFLTVIENTIEPDSWVISGGPGVAVPFACRGANVLVVRQTLRIQEQVARLLEQLTTVADKYGDDSYPTYGRATSACEMVRRRMWSGYPHTGSDRPASSESSPFESPQPEDGDDRIGDALEEKVSVNFLDEPLAEVAAHLREHRQIEVQIDARALEDVNMGTDTPVTIRVANVTLRSALNLMLRDHDLTWIIRDDMLTITTPEEAIQHQTTRTYDLGILTTVYDTKGKAEQNFEALLCAIEATVEPDSWEMIGNPCSISAMEVRGAKVLVVRQTREGHEKVAWLLKELKSIADRYGDDVFPVIEPVHTDAESEDRQGGERVGAGEDGS